MKAEFYEELETEIKRCYFSNTKFINAGDMNAKLNEGTNKNYNAKLLFQLIEEQKLEVLNFLEVTEFWTRIQRKGNTEVKSVLDYLITDVEFSRLTTSGSIDEDKLFTPYRISKKKSQNQIVFTDHCAILASFKIVKGGRRKKPGR